MLLLTVGVQILCWYSYYIIYSTEMTTKLIYIKSDHVLHNGYFDIIIYHYLARRTLLSF